jgi:hypothetical protein
MGIQHVLAIAIPVAIISLIVYGIVYAIRAEKRRREAWAEQALRLGYTFQADDAGLVAGLSALELFSRGDSRKASNVLSGRGAGADVVLFDYSFTTGSGKSRATHLYTVCVQRSPALRLPHVVITPEIRFVSRIVELFGGQDIDFPDDEEFSKKFVVKGEDVDAVRRLLVPPLRSNLLTFRAGYSSFEARGDTWVLACNQLIKPEQAAEFLLRAAETVNLLRSGS